MKKKLVLLLSALLIGSSLTGCFDHATTTAKKNGGLIASSSGDYIVINYSGNKIMDIWKLKDSFVTDNSSSDGCVFTDENGNSIDLQGDVKIIRVDNPVKWDNYKEYHAEFDLVPYEEFVKEN